MTIKDLAKYSGVSVSTVSRVLNNHPDVSKAARSKVLKAASELHYVPNDAARDLVKPQSDVIGVVVRGIENPFFSSVIHSIDRTLDEAGYTMVLHQIRTEEDEIQAGAALVRSKRLKGLILLGGCFDYTPEKTAALEVPFVCCTFTNSFGSLDSASYSSVSIDDRAEAKRIVELLTKNGHQKIAILLDSANDRSIAELRLRGYLEALEGAGVKPDKGLVVETGEFTMDAAYAGTKELLEKGKEFTAIFAISDAMGIAAMKALYDAGKKVPEDCSVVAIDGIDSSIYTIPTLTTLIQPRETMGREAAQILLEVLEGKGTNRHLRPDTRLREGGTVAEPSVKQVFF